MGTGQPLTPELSMIQDYSLTYIDYTLALLVKDYRRHQFNDLEYLQQQDLEIAIFNTPYYQRMIYELLPRAELILIDSYSSYFEHYGDEADALAIVAEMGSSWTLLYPEYAVATPFGGNIKIPVAFPVPLGEESMADLLKNWINLKQKDGTINKLYNYWILGQQEKNHLPRWSIIRDVLHWVH
jgi:ABC-type amino acid transport substrate-binding protein